MSSLSTCPELQPDLGGLAGSILEERYELGRMLGAGGMGAVFEARHLRLDRKVAIKVLQPSLNGDGDFVKRFLREAKAASRVRHRNVVEILDFGEATGGLVYSVMEFLRGRDLQRLLEHQPNQRLPWSRAQGLLLQIVEGLEAVHARGVVHRDIKPANCVVTRDGDELLVKLVDFGIAKLADVDQTQELTSTAQILGTPSYMAPELVCGASFASPRSDIFSLGVLAYKMLTGCRPFTGRTPFELFQKICYEPVPSMRREVAELPASVEAFVLELLAKEPSDRPRDMATVRDRLVSLARKKIDAATGPIQPERSCGASCSQSSANGGACGAAASMASTSHGRVTIDWREGADDGGASRPLRCSRPMRRVIAVGVGLVFIAIAIMSSSQYPRRQAPELDAAAGRSPSSTDEAVPAAVVEMPAVHGPVASRTVARVEATFDDDDARPGDEAPPADAAGTVDERERKVGHGVKARSTTSWADKASKRELTRKVETKCTELAGRAIDVSFIVQPNGRALAGTTSDPLDPASKCILAQLKDMQFYARSRAKPMLVTVRQEP